MKILILSRWYPDPDDPIPGSFVRDQALALSRAGASVTVLHPEVTGFLSPLPARVTSYHEEGVTVLQARARSPLPRIERAYDWMTERLVRRLEERALREGKPDLIHAHVSYPSGIAALRLARRWGVPLVVTEHYAPFSRLVAHPWARRRALEALEGADAVLAVSTALAQAMQAQGVRRPIEVLPNVVDVARFAPTPLPEQAGLNLVSVGGLVPNKDHATLLEALRLFVAERPDQDIRLTLVGDGFLRPQLEAMARAKGLEQHVRFKGALPREEVARALSESHALVMSSVVETFCVAAAEALCAGRPVVSTRSGGPEDFLDESTGEWAAVGDPRDLAQALHRLVERLSEFDAERLARDACRRFSPEAVAQQLLGIYARILESPRR